MVYSKKRRVFQLSIWRPSRAANMILCAMKIHDMRPRMYTRTPANRLRERSELVARIPHSTKIPDLGYSALGPSHTRTVLSVQQVLTGSGLATRRWPMYFPIRRSLPVRPDSDNAFWTDRTVQRPKVVTRVKWSFDNPQTNKLKCEAWRIPISDDAFSEMIGNSRFNREAIRTLQNKVAPVIVRCELIYLEPFWSPAKTSLSFCVGPSERLWLGWRKEKWRRKGKLARL